MANQYGKVSQPGGNKIQTNVTDSYNLPPPSQTLSLATMWGMLDVMTNRDSGPPTKRPL
jgi:hypothetical protein